MTVAPAWFTEALDRQVETAQTSVDGATIHYRAWGEAGKPGLVLVHGGAAHSRWWDHVAPALSQTHRIISLDLSGHGDSDRRDEYSMAQWAREVIGVAEAQQVSDGLIVVGHSMGGLVAFETARTFPEQISRIAMVDSPIHEHVPPDELERRRRRASNLGTVYPERNEALARFHLIPEQIDALEFVLDHIRETSVRAVPEGWTWKFDPRIFMHESVDLDQPFPASVPVWYLRAERGIVPPELLDSMRRHLGSSLTVTEIAHATHHAMVDQPLALIAAIQAVANHLPLAARLQSTIQS